MHTDSKVNITAEQITVILPGGSRPSVLINARGVSIKFGPLITAVGFLILACTKIIFSRE